MCEKTKACLDLEQWGACWRALAGGWMGCRGDGHLSPALLNLASTLNTGVPGVPVCEHMKACLNLAYRGTLLMRNTPLLGPYSMTMRRVLCWSLEGGGVLLSEIPL